MRRAKRQNPQQESWIALQRVIAETLQRRVVDRGEPLATHQEADLLADHIADDLMKLEPLVPPEHWVSEREGRAPQDDRWPGSLPA